MKYPLPLTKLIEILKKLPGVGNKSAERYAFQMLQWTSEELKNMAGTIANTADKLKRCEVCGCLTDEEGCRFCHSDRLTKQMLCVISSPRDAYTIEETREFQGTYHVLGCLLSPLEGQGPEQLGIDKLRRRIVEGGITELVIALDSTLEGDATALYLKSALNDLPIKISRLAFGLPLGSSLDYVDGSTLARAFTARSLY